MHHRRSIRLKGYDYSQAGAYFITICCKHMKCLFGKIENSEMILNEFGQIAFGEWIKPGEQFTNFELDVFQIVPNHMLGILVLVDDGRSSENSGNKLEINVNRAGANATPTTMGDIMGAYKSIVANECLKIWKSQWTRRGSCDNNG